MKEWPLGLDPESVVLGALAAAAEEMREYVRPYIQELVAQGWTQGLDRLGIAGSFDITNEDALEFLDSYTMRFSQSYLDVTAGQVSDLIKSAIEEGQSIGEIADALMAKFPDDLNAMRAERIARTEWSRAQNAGQVAAWGSQGVTALVWRTSPDCCSFCQQLDGKTVGIGEGFAPVGTIIEAEDDFGDPISMQVDYVDVQHPPLHPHCRCNLDPVEID